MARFKLPYCRVIWYFHQNKKYRIKGEPTIMKAYILNFLISFKNIRHLVSFYYVKNTNLSDNENLFPYKFDKYIKLHICKP